MKALILAAGRGQRMMPLTQHMPKPMLKVAEKPLIEHHINNLKAAGITDIVINLAWQGDKIKDYFNDGSQFGVNILYSQEVEGGLETAGGIIQALPLLGESFIVVNGDVYTDYDVSALMQLHLQAGEAHIVLIQNPPHNPDGDFALSHLSPESQKYTFSGISRYQADFFKGLTQGRRPLGPILREKLSKHVISTELYIGQWDDIGTPERLNDLNKRLAAH
ncbi:MULTISPECIES: N-acetylmuramate alpha-1-phosphate uridylyltransferase MurU [Pseudoalteromonas]|uniref:Mannose-1-phosphate guanylyltransferase n=1 Tax=Pseudoalteromonas fuliginea TaxID=1872678 RepID=A0A063KTJ7_9GAMM|nr:MULTISPECIES: nucleotidyltransferase family protein [Pseudoalteromonas]KAA1150290.1 nucleotidyltransferase family protein [Pseudoalteromonas fuliginea]KAA1158538.1 nucleotidyltransferase family protein [Pseudoalteromonas fuliginea]KAA1165028.1 nucleotidyltransferase family protein [Pseudoalteromonas fuliginea]KDC53438.1 mannose-1-phosphate guanylyltransferase [Pseudoalteromonas fuliginea]KDC54691.1 mannose-1-phosphate guanylyltransferase [Pseudoalteromonas sp. S3431]